MTPITAQNTRSLPGDETIAPRHLSAVAAVAYHDEIVVPGLTRAQLLAALDGDAKAMRRVVTKLRPIIHAEIGHRLFRIGKQHGWDPRQECQDFIQDVFVKLLAKKAKALRNWDPRRGPLEVYVRLIARYHVIEISRKKKGNPWSTEAVPDDHFQQQAGDSDLEDRIGARLELELVYERCEQHLDARGLRLFHMLCVERRSVRAAARQLDMKPDAVYAWRSRHLKKLLEEVKTTE